MLKWILYYYAEGQRSVPAKAHGIKVSVALKNLSIYILRKDLKQLQLQGGKPVILLHKAYGCAVPSKQPTTISVIL